MRPAVSLVFATLAAYACSFALDLLLGGLTGAYPSTAYLPVVTWSLISSAALIVALMIARSRRWLALPYLIFGLMAFLGGIVGTSRRNLIVAGLMFFQAFVFWKAVHPVPKS